MSKEASRSQAGSALRDIARDEARFCAMLTHHIRRLGGLPSTATGTFYDKIIALTGAAQRLGLLNRGQAWVVRTLREALPRIDDEALHKDLREMLEVHERNIATCTQLTQTLKPLEYPASEPGGIEDGNHAEEQPTVQWGATTP